MGTSAGMSPPNKATTEENSVTAESQLATITVTSHRLLSREALKSLTVEAYNGKKQYLVRRSSIATTFSNAGTSLEVNYRCVRQLCDNLTVDQRE